MWNRRDFARLVTLSAAAAASVAAAPSASRKDPLKPKALAPGDTLGLVVPATAASTMDEIAFAKEQLEAIGFHVVLGKHVSGLEFLATLIADSEQGVRIKQLRRP